MYYKEYECSGLDFDVRIPTMLVSGFRKKGMIQQADILMNKTVRNIRLDDDKPFTPILQQEWGNEEYVSVVKPLLKLGDVKGSQETYREWKQASGGGGGGEEKGGEMKKLICEKIKMLMQIIGGVVLIIFIVIALFMVLYVAATDPLLAVTALTAAVLCSCAATCPYCLLFLLFSSPSQRTSRRRTDSSKSSIN